MRREPEVVQESTELELEGACILCGGALSMRVGPGSAATYCRACHWISHPRVPRHHGHVSVFHPARLMA